jgi:hypothetical protein
MLSIPMYSNAVTQTGVLNFIVQESTTKEAVSNLSFDVYQIGIKNEQGIFEYSVGFEKSDLNVDTFTEENINIIQEYAVTNANPIFSKTTDSNGKISISGLEEGEYLLVQANNKDKYSVQTILLQIPEVDIDGNCNYTITVKPKISEIEYPETEIANTQVSETRLPSTGILDWPIPVLLVIALVLFCIGWLKEFSTTKKKVD